MIRLMIPVLVAVTVLGCKGQDAQIPLDPFYGQTRIAPPGTGEIARRPAVDPYYPRSAAAPTADGTFRPAQTTGSESPQTYAPTRPPRIEPLQQRS